MLLLFKVLCISKIVRTYHRVRGWVGVVEKSTDGNTVGIHSGSEVVKEKSRTQCFVVVLMEESAVEKCADGNNCPEALLMFQCCEREGQQYFVVVRTRESSTLKLSRV